MRYRISYGNSTFEPEVNLILAVYLQAKYDLASRKASQREQARLFLESEGFDVSKIRPGCYERQAANS